MSNSDELLIPLPTDIPWKLAGRAQPSFTLLGTPSRAAAQTGDSGGGFGEPAFGNLTPSIAIFYHPIPISETKELFPYERLVAIRVSASLSGLALDAAINGTWIDIPYAPCIGAIIDVDLQYLKPNRTTQWPDVTPADFSRDRLYIRDFYPKHQETVVNELLGNETLQRTSSQVTTTKSWNVSGGFSFAGIGGSAGVSESVVRQSMMERSQRDSRQTEVHSIYHVLTGYHQGQAWATFTIQPRPFEGESWELVSGFRQIEGLQEFLLLADVPYDAKYLRIRAAATIGFRAMIKRQPTGFPAGLPSLPNNPGSALKIEGTSFQNLPDVVQDYNDDPVAFPSGWEWKPGDFKKWLEWRNEYDSYRQLRSYLEQVQEQPVLLVTAWHATGSSKLFYGDDPCDDAGPLWQCTGVTGGGRVEQLAEWISEFHPARFSEQFMPLAPVGQNLPERITNTNAHMRDMMRILRSASKQTSGFHLDLADTLTVQRGLLFALANLDSEDPRNTALLRLNIRKQEKRELSKAGIKSVRELAAAALGAPDERVSRVASGALKRLMPRRPRRRRR